MEIHNINADALTDSSLCAAAKASLPLKVENFWRFECRDKDGNLRWIEEIPNLVCTAGKNDILTKYFQGSVYTAVWYIGLVTSTGFTAYAVGDVAAQIGGTNGWTESQNYSQATRIAWAGGAASAGSIDNSASPAAFSINATDTIRGAFLVSSNVKGGTAGLIYGEADFSVARSVLSGDTLSVTVQLTVS
jgi:hypothetical protein